MRVVVAQAIEFAFPHFRKTRCLVGPAAMLIQKA